MQIRQSKLREEKGTIKGRCKDSSEELGINSTTETEK